MVLDRGQDTSGVIEADVRENGHPPAQVTSGERRVEGGTTRTNHDFAVSVQLIEGEVAKDSDSHKLDLQLTQVHSPGRDYVLMTLH
jgi:hypothetical protein